MKLKSKILIIAGSDSSGGAGIQADIKTITALGSYSMTAITAVTAQNTNGVKSIVLIKPKDISNQIEYTSQDIKPDAIKIGMLHNIQVVKAVIKSLEKIKVRKIIYDPVMVSTSGAKLINDNCIKYIKKNFLSKISLLTPNIQEAEIISGKKIKNYNDMKVALKRILSMGVKNVLIKGGHLKGDYVIDIFSNSKEIIMFKNRKLKTKNTHGTGCTLSSAIATFYACGKDLKKSCYLSINYVKDAIRTAPNYGKGNGPINHINNFKLNKKL